MLKQLIQRRKKIKVSYFIKRKAKKKWRFWRVFKFYFLHRKKKFYFFRMKWLFNKKKILWRQLSVVYGKRIKNRVYHKNKSKVIFNKRFMFILRNLELRLNILLVRLHFVTKLLQADIIILKNKVRVNGKIKHKCYIVSVGDLITYHKNDTYSQRFKKLKKIQITIKRRKIKKKNLKKKRKVNMYFLLRKNFILNFMEINYYYFSAILLRNPCLGEISYRNKKQLLISTILKKIYFIY